MRESEELLFGKLPSEYVENMKYLLGDDFDKYKQSLNKDSVRGLRINPLKTTLENFNRVCEFDTSVVPYEKYGRVLTTKEKLGNLPLHASGMIYMQEPSSMLPVSTIEYSGDEKVLDLCAAPGGKSSQVASYVQDGLVVSNEIVTARAKILFSNIERLGIKNSIILNDTPENISNKLTGYFDVVLVDAPCSGEGMFRKDPDTIEEWSASGVLFNAKRQLEILDCADKCLKCGGKLIYSTCTFSEIEDEDVIINFLNNHNYSIQEVKQECNNWTTHGTKIKEARRFFPFTGNGEGQFVCVLQKNEEEEIFEINKRITANFLKGKDKELVINFLKENFEFDFNYNLVYIKDDIMLVNDEMLKLLPQKINIINAGTRIGTIEKGVLKPHHQLFSALGGFAKNKINLTETDYKKYVHGEELDIDSKLKGYACVSIFGASLGGGKCVNGKLKNLYPKGLRI